MMSPEARAAEVLARGGDLQAAIATAMHEDRTPLQLKINALDEEVQRLRAENARLAETIQHAARGADVVRQYLIGGKS